jgi:hypothetical protein
MDRIMRASELYSKSKNQATQYKLWTAPVRIRQPGYTGRIDVTVTASSMQMARQLMKAQYGVQDWQIGSTTEVK